MVPLRILQIVDSENDSAQILRLLQRAGYQVELELVDNGERLRTVLKAGAIDVVVWCCQLRQPDVVKILDVVRESQPELPIFLVSPEIDDETAVELIQSGAQDCVTTDHLARLVPVIEREAKNVVSRRMRDEALETLRRSEERLNLALTTSRMGVWEWDLRTNAVYRSDECLAITGHDDFDGTLDSFMQIVHPLDRDLVWKAVEKALLEKGEYAADFRITTRGEVRWISNIGRVKCDSEGQPAFMIGTVVDSTSRKEEDERRTNQELEQLAANHRLLLSQLHSVREQEMAHLSREIHDEMGQTLTALKMSAYSAEQALTRAETGVALKIVRDLAGKIDGLTQSVRDIATELRPPLLDQAGLTAAVEWQVEKLEKQHGLSITRDFPLIDPVLTEVQKIAAFRIVQESFTNIVRHAGSKSAHISLRDEATAVHIKIQDQGVGFEPGECRPGSLGIFGMYERARLIGASFSIGKNLLHGTIVELIIPKEPASGDRST